MKPKPPTDYVIGPHAAFETARRGLDAKIIRRVLAHPEQEVKVREGRVILVDVDRWPAEVVTVYRTTKISKYWRR